MRHCAQKDDLPHRVNPVWKQVSRSVCIDHHILAVGGNVLGVEQLSMRQLKAPYAKEVRADTGY